ncbi:MAG: sugar phosphate nucleotidyltransferase [Actinomycetota bacterium]|nr:sugar phosphate nucleotidyltransferase [Actinomycetota bacterium]
MSIPKLVVGPDDSMDEALARSNDAGGGLVVVADGEGMVLGTVTDGDIRRAALGGAGLDTPARELMGAPVTVDPSATADEVRDLLEERHLPTAAVVEAGRLVGIRHLAEVGGTQAAVTAVVLAGGRGQRLRPLTDKVPKPLLTVGRTTILERLLEQLWSAGIVDVHLAVNYKAEVFEERLGTGEGYGIDLRYLHERQELGTAGPLSLLDPVPTGPILVTMADQVTSLPFARLIEFHHQQGAAITVAAFMHEVPIPYGVLHLEGERVTGIEEKPTLRRRCNAGIFVIDPEVVALVPPDQMFGMPSVVEAALAKGWPVAAFPILERWIDVGSPDALEAALLSFATGEEV